MLKMAHAPEEAQKSRRTSVQKFSTTFISRTTLTNADKDETPSTKSKLSATKVASIVYSIRRNLSEGMTLRDALDLTSRELSVPLRAIDAIVAQYNKRFPQQKLARGSVELSEEAAEALKLPVSKADLDHYFKIESLRLTSRIYKIFSVECIENPDFLRKDKVHEIMAEMPESSSRPRRAARPHKNMPAYLVSLFDYALLDKAQEAHMFRKYNYLRHQVVKGRQSLNAENPSLEKVEELEGKIKPIEEAFNFILVRNLRLVVYVAKKFATSSDHLLELVSEGNLALRKAVENFNYALGNKFSTYASFAIKKHFTRKFAVEHQMKTRYASGQQVHLNDVFAGEDNSLQREFFVARAADQIEGLIELMDDDRQKKVIRKRFGLGNLPQPEKLDEVGTELGLTKERIRQIEAKGLAKLVEIASSFNFDEESLEITAKADSELGERQKSINYLKKYRNYVSEYPEWEKIILLLWCSGGSSPAEIKCHLMQSNPQAATDYEQSLKKIVRSGLVRLTDSKHGLIYKLNSNLQSQLNSPLAA